MQLTSATTNEETLPCLLIPVQSGRIVLPNVTVAELIPYMKPDPVTNVPDWLIGKVEWRGTMIPIISFEMFSGLKKAPSVGDLRIAVINSPNGEKGNMRFFGMVTQGIPSLIKLEKAAIKENQNSTLQKGHKMSVTLETGHAVIPDLDLIEDAILAESWQ